MHWSTVNVYMPLVFFIYLSGFSNATSYCNIIRTDSPVEVDLWFGGVFGSTPPQPLTQNTTGLSSSVSATGNNNTFSYYVNNIAITTTGTNPFTSANFTAGVSTTTGIGSDRGGNQYMPGYIADFRFYNRALSSTEVNSLYTYT